MYCNTVSHCEVPVSIPRMDRYRPITELSIEYPGGSNALKTWYVNFEADTGYTLTIYSDNCLEPILYTFDPVSNTSICQSHSHGPADFWET